jgi:hypothetical protein
MNFALLFPFLSVLALALLLQGAIENWLERNELLPLFSRPITAWGLTALTGYTVFWAYFCSLRLGLAFAGAIHLGAIVYWFRRRRDFRATFFGTADSHLCRFSLVLIGACYLGLLCLWQSDQSPEYLAANRFMPSLPSDNILPKIIADRLACGQNLKEVFGDWLSSDRPPLQTGFILLLRLPLRWLGDSDTPGGCCSRVVSTPLDSWLMGAATRCGGSAV